MEPIDINYERRFSSLNRLYSNNAIDILAKAHVIIAGIGGVGSWAVEALVRSGIGKITLIDLDNISEGNINRQIHALSDTIGLSKVEAMKGRMEQINPSCDVTMIEDFLTIENISLYLEVLDKNSWIIDAIDEVKVKAALIAFAKCHKYNIITSGAAGGKTKATDLMIDDLNFSYHDSLCARLKSTLKKDYGFPSKPKKMGVPVIFSKENSIKPQGKIESNLNCGGYGSMVTITATMGFMMAGFVINKILENPSL